MTNIPSGGFQSWGRYPRVAQREISMSWHHEPFDLVREDLSYLPVGLGRSYGDSCLNADNTIVHTRPLNRFLSFDQATGVLSCEAGVSLAEILHFSVPRGWFLPVVPGTKYVTVGGAIANDVHGKNHHKHGTFGRFVPEFQLLRSDHSRVRCTPVENAALYRATIGGLGLTGIVLTAKVQLIPISSPRIEMDSMKFRDLGSFFRLSEECAPRYDYSVSWIDCLSSGSKFGRGIFMGGNFVREPEPLVEGSQAKYRVPVDLPGIFLRRPTMQLFNDLYYGKQRRNLVRSRVSYDSFFFPLDAVLEWNRLYGKNGFFQFQCVIGKEGVAELLDQVVQSGAGSFLAVLKEFGALNSPGLLSFPKPGFTLAMDFANRGPQTVRLLRRLDEIVGAHGGRIYPAKDAVMPSASFERYFPQWRELAAVKDPRASSSFWRRVTESRESQEDRRE